MMNPPELEVRNLHFDVTDDVPRYWHGGRRSITFFYDNLSIFFPAGEKFFIAAVKAHAAGVDDPRLQQEMRAFCAQEGIHSREHIRYNEMLRRRGYPIEAMEQRVEQLLARAGRRTTARGRLAATCALEHFTALLAHFLLSNEPLLDGAHPVMAELWRWHAAEESEHKAVAYDVYRATGGGYFERIVAMMIASFVFWAKVFEHQVRLMQTNGILFSASEWYALFRHLFIEPGRLASLFWPYLAYYRPSFHPWELDNRHLLDAWKRERSVGFAYGGHASVAIADSRPIQSA